MHSKLHVLCSLCKRLKFDTQQASSDRSWEGELQQHAASLDDLNTSACNGCHLCSLFASGLRCCRSIEVPGQSRLDAPGQSGGVTVEYVPHYRVGSFLTSDGYSYGERLEIRCGSMWVPLYIESLPTRECYSEDQYFNVLTKGSKSLGRPYPQYWSKLLQPPHPSCSCGKGVWEPILLSHGRTSYSNEDPSSIAVFAQIEDWIKRCHDHPQCHSFKFEPSMLPARIIDVGPSDGSQDPHLCAGEDKSGRYITLSYRWCNAASITTTSTTIDKREAGIPIDNLPLTLRDAVRVTRQLKIRYLWIDALCILQDSEKDWNEQSALLGEIYQNAWLNISADVGANSNAGFLATRNQLEIQGCKHPTLLNPASSLEKIVCPYIGEPADAINRNVLTKRGWIFPERLFSKRIIHWSYHEVIWECNSILASERHPNPLGPSPHIESSNWKKIRQIAGRSAKAQNLDLFQAHYGHQDYMAARKWLLRARFFEPWYHLVREYSKRTFTQPADKLPAISSLATFFQQQLPVKPTYVAGLWREDLSCGLAWSVDCNIHERDNTTALQNAGGLNDPHMRSGLSFSWASVDRPVRFYNNIDSYYHNPESEPEILEAHSELTGSDISGKVSTAAIKLRAETGHLEYVLSQTPSIIHEDLNYLLDEPKLKKDFEGLVCQVVLMYIGSATDCRDQMYSGNPGSPRELYIMLLPLAGKGSPYCRIGLLHTDMGIRRFLEKGIITII